MQIMTTDAVFLKILGPAHAGIRCSSRLGARAPLERIPSLCSALCIQRRCPALLLPLNPGKKED